MAGTGDKQFTSFSSKDGAQYKSYSFSKNQNATQTNSGVGTQSGSNSSSSEDPSQIDVLVKAAPNEMEGIQGLWKIAIDCVDTRVGKCVTRLLLKLHTDVDFGMENQIPIFEDQFVGSCMHIIKEQC